MHAAPANSADARYALLQRQFRAAQFREGRPRFVAERALKGQPVDAALTDRALQIADRCGLGITQRAITDSTARMLAATPALRERLEQEQTQRQAVALLFGKLGRTPAPEDKLRRDAQGDAFKALPEADRKAHAERQQAVPDQIKAQQAEATSARAALTGRGLMPGALPGISKPALAMAANADERESPLLELDDVLGLRRNAQWVLLSACNTAAGEQGCAAMSGLVRGRPPSRPRRVRCRVPAARHRAPKPCARRNSR